MAEKGQTSSMTSVTEEDTSADSESDTTQSSFSNITSSILSSTDTDDKLTPGVFSISLSNTTCEDKGPQIHKQVENKKAEIDLDQDNNLTGKEDKINTNENKSSRVGLPIANVIHPYGSNPLPLGHPRQHERRIRNGTCSYRLPCESYEKLPYVKQKLGRYCHENLGVEDSDNTLSTDLSDTSSIQKGSNMDSNDFDIESNEEGEAKSTDKHKRPYLPDLSSGQWYQARCFDHYWSHYRFVMDWYQYHLQTVKSLHKQMSGALRSQPYLYSHGFQKPCWVGCGRRRRTRRRRRHAARNKAKEGSEHEVASATDDTEHTQSSSQPAQADGDDELEMEITEDMMEFFTTSYKHKMERDKQGEEGPVSLAPTEQPGVRRTAEMRELYGAGAAMIQGMETAMQMTFDRFSDRFQPSLWPNMPIRINFKK